MTKLTTEERGALETWLKVQKRPLRCKDGKPMGHEDLLRDESGQVIFSEETGRAEGYVGECELKHVGCPHLIEDNEKLQSVLKRVRIVLRKLNERTVGRKVDRIELIRAYPLHELDQRHRAARTGNEQFVPLRTEIPTPEDVAKKLVPLDKRWHRIMQKIEPLRQIVIEGLERILAEAEVEISSQ